MRPYKGLKEDAQDIYTTFTTIILAAPVLLIVVYLAVLMFTSCKGWEVRFQGDLNEERWESRQRK